MMNERTQQPRHILVVDDEPLVRQTVQMLLQDDGYVVDEAESGPQALAMFEPGKFDMVFTDYFMLLQDDGYVVDEAESGPQALAMFEPGKFDMVFTDYFMLLQDDGYVVDE